MAFLWDAGALVLVGCYGLLALVCFSQMVLMRRARHSGPFFAVLVLACMLCLLRVCFFLKTMFVAGGRDLVSYSVILAVYLVPYALFFSMNSALVVYYSQAVAKASVALPAHRQGSQGSAAGSAWSRPFLGVMTVAASAIYGVFVVWLAVCDGVQDDAPRPLRWFYLLWTSLSDMVICVLVKVWGDRYARGRHARAPRVHAAGQFELLNYTLCLALFGHAVYAILSYAEVLPDGLTYIYFLGNHRRLSGSRALVFVLSECIPVAAYAGLFLHMPEKMARNLSVDAPSGYSALAAAVSGAHATHDALSQQHGGDPQRQNDAALRASLRGSLGAGPLPSTDSAPPPPPAPIPSSPAIDVRSYLHASNDGNSETASNASLAFSGTNSSFAAEHAVKSARTRALLAAPQEGVNAISPHEILQSYGRGRRS